MIFTRETTEIPTQKLKIVTKISRWDNYECVDIRDMKYIRGFNLDNAIDMCQFELVDSPLILYKFMELKQKLSKEIFDYNQHYINEHLTDNDIDLILNFCKKNGLPFWNKNITVDVFRNQEDEKNENMQDLEEQSLCHEIIPLSTENFFPISSFIVGLLELHLDFLRVVSANNWEDDENIHFLLSKEDKDKIINIRKIQSQHNNVELFTPCLCPYYTFWNNKAMSLQLNCNNIMHLSTYHLCTLQQAQDYSGGYIRVCPKCNQIFVATTPQQKFCNNPCTRQAYYSAKKKQRRVIIDETT